MHLKNEMTVPELEIHSVHSDNANSIVASIEGEPIRDNVAFIKPRSLEALDCLSDDDGSLPCFTWSYESNNDDEDDGDFSVAMKESIGAIRDEAERVDKILEADRLDSMRHEFSFVARQLKARKTEVQELKSTVAQANMALGKLELERDLYKVDSEKLRSDLQHVSSRLKSIDVRESSVISERDFTVNPSGEASIDARAENATSTLPPPSIQSPSFEASDLSNIYGPGDLSTMSGSVVVRSSKKRLHSLFKRIRCKGQSRNPPTVATVGMNSSLNAQSTNPHKEELERQLATCMETSNQLRRRLASVSSYYGSLVHQLQDDLVEEKSQRTRTQTDLARQLEEISRELAQGSWQPSFL